MAVHVAPGTIGSSVLVHQYTRSLLSQALTLRRERAAPECKRIGFRRHSGRPRRGDPARRTARLGAADTHRRRQAQRRSTTPRACESSPRRSASTSTPCAPSTNGYEQEGLIESQQGSGTFVAAYPEANIRSSHDRRRCCTRGPRDRRRPARGRRCALRLAGVCAGRPRTTRRRNDACCASRSPRSSRPSGRSKPNTQASRLHRTETGTSIGPALLDAAELERIQAHLVRRLAVVQGAIDTLVSEEDTDQGKGHEGQPAPSRSPAARGRATRRPAPAGA